MLETPKGVGMAEYTVVKVSDVPDQSQNLGHNPQQFEIRFLRNDLGCEDCGVSFARYSNGFASEAHTHNRQEEIYVLVSGRAQALVGDNEVIDLERGRRSESPQRRHARSGSSATRTRSSSRSALRTPARAMRAACRTTSPGRTRPRPRVPGGRAPAAA
jgi:mannose-6-phosphate isomerase-like protein (cupin superfamily)